MIPIFIKVHTDDGLMRVNVNKIEKYYPVRCNTFGGNFKDKTYLDYDTNLLGVHETPIQIDNLIKKATSEAFQRIDEVL